MQLMAVNVLVLMIVVIMIPVLVGVYVYRDAKRREMNAVLWTLIAIIAPSLIGFIIYLLVRGNYSNLRCPQCNTPVNDQYVVCPGCGAKLRPTCPNCSTPTEPGWKVCPHCAQPLPEMQENIVSPVRPKDKTLWKILLAIIIIPVLLLLVLGISFSAASGGGASSMREVSFDEYLQDQEVPTATKEYVQNWMDGLTPDLNHAYALMYEKTYEPERSDGRNDYYYLVYIPRGGEVNQRGFGYSSGLFSDSFKLELEGSHGQDGLYCLMTTSKKGGPNLKITLDGQKLDAIVTEVDFNPTLYTIASEYDYSTLTNAAGDLYVEEMEKEMLPVAVEIQKMVDGEQADVVNFTESDLLLNAVVEIHELHYMDEPPTFLNEYEYTDYYEIIVFYADTTGEAHYEDACEYRVIEENGNYYMIELDSGHVYEISAEGYEKLSAIFE